MKGKACHNPKNKEMFGRYKRCISTLHRVLREKLFTHSEFCKQCFNIKFVCVPRHATMEEAFGYNILIDQEKILREKILGETLFKIPILVNDIEGYVEWLLREHFGFV